MNDPLCDQDRVILLSLKPRYAEAILSGAKTVELRRTRPRMSVPTSALIYASTPARCLVGTCRVDSVVTLPVDELWAAHGEFAGVSGSEFYSYFAGLDTGTGLLLSAAERVERPVALEDLRLSVGGFAPPQSFRYLPMSTSRRLLARAS
jgi:predicted transcriptional regulator